MPIGLGRQRLSEDETRLAVIGIEFGQQRIVIARIDHDKTASWFFAPERIMAGPPISIFSIVV